MFNIKNLFLLKFLGSNYFKPDKVHRRYLEKLISKNGGNVQQYCNVIPRSAYKNSYIITDTPSHTCNYFLGLGLGIPSYHHRHIENAVSKVSCI